MNHLLRHQRDFFQRLQGIYQQTPAVIPATIGLVGGILCLLQLAVIPSRSIALLATAAAIICCYFRKHLLFGMCLTMLSCYVNLPSLYPTTLVDCNYSIHLQKRGYYSKVVEAEAKNIVCSQQKINNQSILLWDADKALRQLGVVYEVKSNLAAVDKRLNLYDFDYQRYLYQQGIVLEAKQIKSINKTDEMQSYPQQINALRQTIQNTLQNRLSKDNAAIAIALVTGDRGYLSDTQKLTIQQSATQHMLAISGLHLTLVGVFSWLLVQFLWSFLPFVQRFIPPIQAGALCAWLAITVYAAISGFALPTQRAWIMFSVILLNWIFLRSISAYTLVVALFIILLFQPLALFSSSLYLSFIATFVVLWTVKQRWIPIVKIIFMQVFICLALTPTIWYHFGTIPVAGLVSNLLVIPWLTLLILPSLALALLLNNFPLGEISNFAWQFAEFVLAALDSTLAWSASLELNITPNWTPPLASIVIATVAVIAGLLFKRALLLVIFVLPLLYVQLSYPPEIILADRQQTGALIHNGKEAIIINPGWRYGRRNDAELWLKILRYKNLTLKAIVLQDNRSSLAAATKTLLDYAPDSKVILLKNSDFPFASSFCTNFNTNNLAIINEKNGENCYSTFRWMGQEFSLFNDKLPLQIQAKSTLVINDKTYRSKELGMISVFLQDNEMTIDYSKKDKVLWRESLATSE